MSKSVCIGGVYIFKAQILDVAEKALKIAGEMCIYTNSHITVEVV